MKKTSAFAIFLVALLVVLLGAAAFLFVPITMVNPIENTFDALFFDTDTVQSLANTFQKKGVHVEAEAKIPEDILPQGISIKVDSLTVGKKDKAKTQTELTVASKDSKASYTVYVDDRIIALAGLQDEDDKFVSLPRKDIEDAAEGSIFYSRSNSKYKIPKGTDYQELVDFLKSFSADEKEREDAAITASVERVLERWDRLLKAKNKLGFAEEGFGLSRTVTYTLDEKTVGKMLDAVKEEAEENESFHKLYQYTDEKGNEKGLADYCEELKESLRDMEIVFSYTVVGGRFTDLKFSYRVKNEWDKNNTTELDVTFLYDEDEPGFDFTLTRTTERKDRDSVRTEKGSYRKKVSDGKTTATFEMDGNYLIGGKLLSTETGAIKLTLTYEESGDWSLKTEGGKNAVSVEVGGQLNLDKKKGEASFTLNQLFIGNVGIKADVITLSAKKPSAKQKVSTPDHAPLLEMNEEEFEEFFHGISLKKPLAVLEDWTGQPIANSLSLTIEGAPLWNSEACLEKATEYYKAYQSKGLTGKVYVYYEESDVYVLISANKIDFAYELTDQIKRIYTEATISNGSMTFPK